MPFVRGSYSMIVHSYLSLITPSSLLIHINICNLFLHHPKRQFVKYKDCIEILIHNKQICDYTIPTNKPPSHVTKYSKSMTIYNCIYQEERIKRERCMLFQLAFHIDEISQLAFHKMINEGEV